MTERMERRDFIQSVGLLAGAAATATLIEQPAFGQTAPPTGANPMTYQPKPMAFDPKAIKDFEKSRAIGEKHHVGAVKRLTAISAQLADLDFAKAPNFVINGLKREELIAANSMILHEVYFDGLGGGGAPHGALANAIVRDFGSIDRWRTEFSAAARPGRRIRWSSSPVRRGQGAANQRPPTIRQRSPEAGRSSFSTCTSTPITWTTVRPRRAMSMSSWRRSAGTMRASSTAL